MRTHWPKLMSCRWLTALAIFSCFVTSVRADVDPNPEKALVGRWVCNNDELPDGYFSFMDRKPDGTAIFLETYTKTGFTVYSELTWKITGKTITDTTVRSTEQRRPKGVPLTSEIVSLDAKNLVSRNAKGETRTEMREDKMPDFIQTKVEEMSRALPLAGTWQYKSAELFGGFEGYTIIQGDGGLIQIGHALKSDKWLFFEILWKFDGNIIKSTIRRSNLPSVPPGTRTETKVVSVDEKTYTYLEGGEGGTKRIETRVDTLPIEFRAKLAELWKTVPYPTPAPSAAPAAPAK